MLEDQSMLSVCSLLMQVVFTRVHLHVMPLYNDLNLFYNTNIIRYQETLAHRSVYAWNSAPVFSATGVPVSLLKIDLLKHLHVK